MPRAIRQAVEAASSTRPKQRPARKREAPANGVNYDAVAERAYEIYKSRGGDHGADLEDWLEAERQLQPGSGRPKESTRAKSRK